MLADTAEVNNPQNLEMHKSDLELWRLLKYNFDRAPAFNVISILENIRNMQAAMNMHDVVSEVNVLERRREECFGQAVRSKEPEFVKMKTHGNSVYPEVFKKADLLKVLPDVMVKDLKESTNIDFGKDSYSKIRNADTTIVHNHKNAASRRRRHMEKVMSTN